MFRSVNPFNNEILQEFPVISDAQVESAIEKGHAAFQGWKSSSFQERAALLMRCSDLLLEKKSALAELITLEMGKVLKESNAEIEKSALGCRYYADNGEAFMKVESLNVDEHDAFISYQPLGIVLAIMPWNFPFWQVFRFAAPALMAGNAAILKHAPNVPQCALAIEDIFTEAGAPSGLFQSVFIDNTTAGKAIGDDRIKAVTLTGSERAGSSVAGTAGKYIKKTLLELGGSDPFIVLPDADLERAAEIGTLGRMINCGQSCIAAKRFVLHKEISDSFIEKLTSRITALKMGDPMDPETGYGPMARLDLADNLDRQVNGSLKEGAEKLIESHRPDSGKALYPATILRNVKPGMPAFHEEIFGPVASIIEVETEDAAVSVANKTRYGLGASIWTSDIEKGKKLALEIESGSVFINKLVSSHPAIPFGGTKLSGYGRELSHLGIREFVNTKSIVF